MGALLQTLERVGQTSLEPVRAYPDYDRAPMAAADLPHIHLFFFTYGAWPLAPDCDSLPLLAGLSAKGPLRGPVHHYSRYGCP